MSINPIRWALGATLALLLLAIPNHGFAQLTVNQQTDLTQLARTITGPGVKISNPQIDCHSDGYGEFQYTGSLLGIDEGIILTSGKIAYAVGPNNVEDKTFQQNRSGNSILNTVTGKKTYDACLFEFDVIPGGDSLQFDFVFASEEYNEWVGSQYNDVFGFFISGPGITGDPGIGNQKNIALIPGTDQAVTINNVNNASNPEYYYDNAGGQHIQYDGFTQGLSAIAEVQPCETYHLKLIVADASDRKYDSGVFIAKVKSNPISMALFTENAGDSLIEGCNNGFVRFTRQLVDDEPLTLEYYLHGTATNGVDYDAIGDPDPAVAKTITIPANQAYADQPINVIADGITEGMETMLFILGNPNCPEAYADTLVVPIVDSLYASVSPTVSVICPDGEVQLLASGGDDYSWSPSAGLSATDVADPTAHPNATTTYSVTVSYGDCSTTLETEVKVSNMVASASITKPLCNGASNGAINLTVNGGIAPYSFEWSGPNGFSATTEDIANIPAGTYTVTISDAGCSITESFNVGQPAELTVSLTPSLLIFGQNISCHGGDDGEIDATITGGTGPYTTSWSGPNGFTSSSVDITGLIAGTYSIQVTDANGCTATTSETLVETGPMAAEISSTEDVQCVGDGQGSATVNVTGGMPVYSYSWNTVPVQTTATAQGLTPGTYTVTATDQYGCSIQATATINGPTVPLAVQLDGKSNVTCNGAANGTATVSVSGGTPNYEVSWNTTPPQTGLTANGLSGGTYTATVTDVNGCQATKEVTIAEPAQALALNIDAKQNINCHGQSTGSATVHATGGTGPYSYSWNTSPSHSGASISGLPAGTWTVTATDINGCTATKEVDIEQPAEALSAVISANNPVLCAGGASGSATVTVSGGTGPYTYNWNTTPAQHGATATGLAVGTWQVSIEDAKGCTTQATAEITEPAPLALSGVVEPAQCQGSASGAVDLTTSGGIAPYGWSWTGPNGFTSSSEDIQSLAAGGYTVTATDANGCTASRSFDVNQPGLFEVSATVSIYGNANVSCRSNADGFIDLTVTGAVPPYQFSWTGPNGFTSTDEDLNNIPAGTYHVNITDHNGCSTNHEVILLAPTAVQVQLNPGTHGGSNISCNGGNDGSITVTISGGNPPYSSSWNGPNGFTSTDADLTGLVAGTYVLTVTDANGCIAEQSITLTQPLSLVASNGGTSPVTCFGSNTGQAIVLVSGGREPYTYNWNTSPAQHNATATGLAAGSYTVQVSDANGCHTSTTIVVGGPEGPLALSTTSTTPVLCHGGATGTATVAASGGTGPYTYTWNTEPAQSGPQAIGLGAGTWSVTVTDAAGCIATRNVVITQPQQALSANLANTHAVSCFGTNDGSVSLQVSGGSGDYNITWNTNPVQTGPTATGLGVGTYTATITDANGCPQALEFPVSIAGPTEPLDITTTPFTYPGGAHVSCPGNADGSIDVSVSGGTPGYGYLWQDGQGGTFTTEDPANLAAGTYYLQVTDDHGCTANTTVTLTPPIPVTATANVQPALCHGESSGAIDLSISGGHGPYSYSWTGPYDFTAGTEDLSMIPAGVYIVTVNDANGCTVQQPFDVTEPGTFTFNPTIQEVSCNYSTDGSIEVMVGGGTLPYMYTWSGPNGFTSSEPDIHDLEGGTYHLILTDFNGCSALFTATLDAPPVLTAFIEPGDPISCNASADGTINVTVAGGTLPYTFEWTGPNGYTAGTEDIAGLDAGTYTLLVTDANGCTVSTGTTLEAPAALSATVTPTTYAGGFHVSCSGKTDGAIILNVQGGTAAYAVEWTGPNGYTSDDWQISGLAPGSYTAEVTDANGCTTTAATVLTAPDPLALTPVAADIPCNGGSTGGITLDVTGGSGTYTFQWSGPGAFAAGTQDIADLIAGTYEVLVSDNNGCTATASVTVAQATPIEVSAMISTAECQGGNTGAVDLTVSGGAGGYTYAWTGFPAFSADTEDISDLFAGVYTVTITDAAGCSTTISYNVGEPDLFQISAELSSQPGGFNVSCAGGDDGAIDVTVTGGTEPYTYFWNGPNGFTSIDLDLEDLTAGQYTLTVHDANGCNSSANFTLVAPQPLEVGLVATAQPGCFKSDDGSILATISGGLAPYSATWTGPDGNMGMGESLTGLGTGTYEVSVTDALGCTATGSITLTAPSDIEAVATPQVLANGANLSCANSGDGSIDLNVQGGTAPYIVDWDGPNGYHSNSFDIDGLEAGVYTAYITDHNGCYSVVQVELTAPDELVLDLATSSYSGGNNISCSYAADGSITLAISGGSPAYDVNWTGPNGFTSSDLNLEDLAAGNYQVTVTDAAGCMATASANLIAPPPLNTTATLSDYDSFQVGCDGNDGAIDITVTGGLAPYQFGWTGPNGFAATTEDIQDLAAGTYNLEVLDANGCSVTRSFTLSSPEELLLELAVTSNECDITSNGEIDLAILGGVGPFTIEWTGPDGFSSTDEDLDGLASGTYHVTVTSAMGCSSSAQATVIAAAPMDIELYASDYGQVNIPCHGGTTGTIELEVTGGFEPLDIQWTGPDGYTASTPNINGLGAGSYTATITDSHGCVRDASITLLDPDTPLVTTLEANNVLCHGALDGSILTTVTGGAEPYIFDWRGPDSTFYSTQDIVQIGAGDYELVVTDANQCVNTLQVTITEPDNGLELTYDVVDYNGVNTSCSDGNDGAINLFAAGGTAGYTYSWTGPNGFTADTDSITGLEPGIYAVTVTDANGCTAETEFELEAPAPIEVELTAETLPSGSHISCHGTEDGALNAEVNGGTGTLTWEWNGPDGFSSADLEIGSLAPGTYCLNVEDANGCAAQECFTIVEPEELSVSTTTTTAPCGLETGSIESTVTGGTAPYNYDWSNGAQTQDLTQVPAGSYELVVTDANGCETTVVAVVDGSPAVEAEALIDGPLCHDSEDGSILLVVSSGSAPFTFAWDDGTDGISLEGLAAGEYGVTITDDLGCQWAETIIVTGPDALEVDTVISHYASGHNVSSWGGHDGSITLHPFGGTPPYAYAWEDGSDADERFGLPAGTYQVTITDANGCSVELAIILTEPDDLAMPTGFTPNGDGQNDAFVVRGIDAWPNNQLTVFNRWGNVVFDQLNYKNDWRGENMQGQDLPNGTYFVILRLGDAHILQNYVDLRR